jgi:hypothetical protein
MRWAVHVAGISATINIYRIFVRNLKRRKKLRDPGMEGRIILNLKKQDMRICTGFVWFKTGTSFKNM